MVLEGESPDVAIGLFPGAFKGGIPCDDMQHPPSIGHQSFFRIVIDSGKLDGHPPFDIVQSKDAMTLSIPSGIPFIPTAGGL